MFPSKGFSYTVLNELLSVFWQRYLDRLVDSLQQKLKISEKMVSSRKIVVEKRQTAAKEQMNLEPKLDIIRSKTKELQWQVRGWLIENTANEPLLSGPSHILSLYSGSKCLKCHFLWKGARSDVVQSLLFKYSLFLQVAEEISKKYKNRPVNIMGEINII